MASSTSVVITFTNPSASSRSGTAEDPTPPVIADGTTIPPYVTYFVPARVSGLPEDQGGYCTGHECSELGSMCTDAGLQCVQLSTSPCAVCDRQSAQPDNGEQYPPIELSPQSGDRPRTSAAIESSIITTAHKAPLGATGPGAIIFLATGAAVGIGVVRRRWLS